MLSGLLATGQAAGTAAAARARRRVAKTVQAAIPEVAVTIADDAVVLTGRIAPDDPRLRWIGSAVR